jgi:hypothetical protein
MRVQHFGTIRVSLLSLFSVNILNFLLIVILIKYICFVFIKCSVSFIAVHFRVLPPCKPPSVAKIRLILINNNNNNNNNSANKDKNSPQGYTLTNNYLKLINNICD